MQMKRLLLSSALLGSALSQSLKQALASNKMLSGLNDALSTFPDLVNTLSSAKNITILAPSNQAFQTFMKSDAAADMKPAMIEATLQYHVLKGTFKASDIPTEVTFVPSMLANSSYADVSNGQVVGAMRDGQDVTFFSGLLEDSMVEKADLEFDGGVVHIINNVLTVPVTISETALAANLTGIAGAVTTADLTKTVDNTRDLTVFAPSNEAFEAISGVLSDLSVSELASILSYHVIRGTVGYSSDLKDGMSLQTLAGSKVTITIDGNDIFVNSARVITPNVLVKNGVVHVIDNVLNPNSTATPASTATSGKPAYPTGSSTNLAFTTDLPKPSTTISTDMPGTTQGGSGGSSSSTTGPTGSAPVVTAAVEMAALIGAGAALLNY